MLGAALAERLVDRAGSALLVRICGVFAAGGRADPDRPGSGLARVVGLGYTGMAAGPAIIALSPTRSACTSRC